MLYTAVGSRHTFIIPAANRVCECPSALRLFKFRNFSLDQGQLFAQLSGNAGSQRPACSRSCTRASSTRLRARVRSGPREVLDALDPSLLGCCR